MTEAAKEARRAYKRAWNREHREQVKQHQETYWAKRAAQAEAEKAEREVTQEETEGAI